MKNNFLKVLFFSFILLSFQYWLSTIESYSFPSYGDQNVENLVDARNHYIQKRLSSYSKYSNGGFENIINRYHFVEGMGKRIIWQESEWIPDYVEKRLYQLSVIRFNSSMLAGNTSVDKDIQFASTKDYIIYIPRALTIGLFSPFPEFWTGEASNPTMTLARKVVGLTTAVFYIFLIAFAVSARRHIYKPQFLAILVFCLISILLYSCIQPNIGSLIRYRYGFYMLLVSFGFATIIEVISLRRKRTN